MPEPITEYAEKRPKSANLRRGVLHNYIRHVAAAPDMPLSDAEAYAANYLQLPTEEQAKHIFQYLGFLKETKTPGTTNMYLSIIRDWHKKNKIRFDDDFGDEIKQALPPNYSVTEDEALTLEKLRAIVAHADPLLKAFILLSCSSGARIGEIMSLHYDDIEYFEEYDAYSFRLSHKATKAGKSHRYFFSHEAMQAIDDFMKVRPQYIRSRSSKTQHCLKHEEKVSDSLFVLTSYAVRLKLDTAVKKAGLHSVDKQSRRARIHPHSFRKFADTQFKEVVGINMGNELIGHDEGLSKSYRRYDMRQKTDAYRKIEPFVTIQAPGDYVQIKSRLGGEVEKMQATVAAQSLELAELKKRLEFTEIVLEIANRHII